MTLNQIVTNPFFQIVSLLFGGILGSIAIYILTKKNKKPCYIIKNSYLIRGLSSKIDDLKIYYNRELVENLTISKLVFWNAGKKIIFQKDIAPADPITINVEEGYEILKPTEIIYQENRANGFSIDEIDDRSFALNFNYIDKNEGIIIQIFHTGEGVELKGSIIGASKINNLGETKEWIFIPIGILILALSIIFIPINFLYKFNVDPIYLYIGLILIVFILIIILLSNKPPRNLGDILSRE